jgi:hypothetical protein
MLISNSAQNSRRRTYLPPDSNQMLGIYARNTFDSSELPFIPLYHYSQKDKEKHSQTSMQLQGTKPAQDTSCFLCSLDTYHSSYIGCVVHNATHCLERMFCILDSAPSRPWAPIDPDRNCTRSRGNRQSCNFLAHRAAGRIPDALDPPSVSSTWNSSLSATCLPSL